MKHRNLFHKFVGDTCETTPFPNINFFIFKAVHNHAIIDHVAAWPAL